MSGLDLRVIDDGRGRGAQGVHLTLERRGPGERQHVIGDGVIGADGRLDGLLQTPLDSGRYCATLRLTSYFVAQDIVPLFPELHVIFDMRDNSAPLRLRVHVSAHAHSVVREP